MRKIYMAGPFFNDQEIAIASRLEETLEHFKQYHIKRYGEKLIYFSPRKDGGNDKLQGSVKEKASAIFENNIDAMAWASECIAILDRPQMPDQGIYLCQKGPLDNMVQAIKGPFEQTDLGTAWELGWFHGRNVTRPPPSRTAIAGFTTKKKEEGRLNLMLAQGMDVVLFGWEQLEIWLSERTAENALSCFGTNKLAKWQGDVL